MTKGRPESRRARRDIELWIALRESALKDNIWIRLPLKEDTALERRLHEEYISRYGYEPITDTPFLLEKSFNRLSVMWDVAGWL